MIRDLRCPSEKVSLTKPLLEEIGHRLQSMRNSKEEEEEEGKESLDTQSSSFSFDARMDFRVETSSS